MQVSKRMALHGLNVAMAVFTGISAYGLLLYFGDNPEIVLATPLGTTLLFVLGIAASIGGICYFGIQLDRRKSEDHKAEERRKADESARKGRRKPVRPE